MFDPHPTSADLAYLDVSTIRTRLADGSLTSTELVRTLLERVDALDGPSTVTALRAVAAVNAAALEDANRRDADRSSGARGALEGVPVLIKDNVEVTGMPGLAGSTALRGRPSRDATLVTRLRDAGAIVLATTNLSQWANMRSPRSTSGWSASGGLVANPWALDRSAGGSSSGTGAGLAAGYAPLGVGTETDGSIVCPASVNGVVGLKPTVGVVPTTRVVPISASQDSPGPMGRRVADVATFFSVLSARPPASAKPALRFAVAINETTGHPATDRCFTKLIEELRASGAEVVDREVATYDDAVLGDEFTVLLAEFLDDLDEYLASRPGEGVRGMRDVVAYENEHASEELPFFGHELLDMALLSGGRAATTYREARARNLTWAVENCLTPALEGVDVVLAPAYGPAWKSDLTIGGHAGVAASHVTTPSAIAGWPIMSVPMGLVEGLPVGVALVGRAHDEWTLLAAARVLEQLVEARGPSPRPSWPDARRG